MVLKKVGYNLDKSCRYVSIDLCLYVIALNTEIYRDQFIQGINPDFCFLILRGILLEKKSFHLYVLWISF